jgi:hypothetical protein
LGQLEVHVVEDAEELGTELQAAALMNRNGLKRRESPLLKRRLIKRIPSDVAEYSKNTRSGLIGRF